MRRAIYAAAIAAVFASPPLAAKTLHVGLDVSSSARVVKDATYNAIIADAVKSEVAKLTYGDWIEVRFIGERKSENLKRGSIQITRKDKPEEAAAVIAATITSLVKKPREADNQTNILAFLEFGRFRCSEGNSIWLVTDGVESSSVITHKQLLAGRKLPAPEAGLRAGCDVTMLGVGQADGLTPQNAKTIRTAWTEWMRAAGANSFTAIVDP